MMQKPVQNKYWDVFIGQDAKCIFAGQQPHATNPVILKLPLPAVGNDDNSRNSSSIRIIHITSKLMFTFTNNTDYQGKITASVQLVFAKVNQAPNIQDLYIQDANGQYTKMSMTNPQEYKKFIWMRGHLHRKSYTQPTSALVPVNADNSQAANLYSSRSGKCNISPTFNRDSAVDSMYPEMYQPYLVFRSDSQLSGVSPDEIFNDPVLITGQIRFTFVDN